MNNHISLLDGVRGIAILFVLFYHIGLIKSGFLGVDIFFILSGFLIAMVINNQHKNKKFTFYSFYVKRIFRIFPMALFVLIISFVFAYYILFKKNLKNF